MRRVAAVVGVVALLALASVAGAQAPPPNSVFAPSLAGVIAGGAGATLIGEGRAVNNACDAAHTPALCRLQFMDWKITNDGGGLFTYEYQVRASRRTSKG